MEMTLRAVGVVRASDRVLEIGCGCGAMVPSLARMLGPAGTYLGFDVHGPSVRWCRRQFASDPRLGFELAELSSPYGKRSNGVPVAIYRFPCDDGTVDLVLAKSVFTHLLQADAQHYLHEIRRALRPGGRAVITAFLFDPKTQPPAFPYPDHPSAVRWLRRWRIHAGVAFDRGCFEAMIAAADLRLEAMIPGYWPGTDAVPTGQDILVLAHRGTSD